MYTLYTQVCLPATDLSRDVGDQLESQSVRPGDTDELVPVPCHNVGNVKSSCKIHWNLFRVPEMKKWGSILPMSIKNLLFSNLQYI